jgi:GrpB-like predicted nucleotidyltransferase (UPF0157 family)
MEMPPQFNHRVVLVAYDPDWESAFQDAARDLLRYAAGQLITIEHIGSTAIPGLQSKPVIDLLGESAWPNLEPGSLVEALSPLGYLYRPGEFTDRLLFSRWNVTTLTHNLHIVPRGSVATRNEVLFRDRLRRDLTARVRYVELKRAAAARSYADPHGYGRAKTDFVFTVVSEERERLGLAPWDIWATLGPERRDGWLENESRLPPSPRGI